MTHPTDEGCGFYTDLPDHGSRDRFPPLNDDFEEKLSFAERWIDRAARYVNVALVALLFVMLVVHFSSVWDGAATHPDPVEVQ